MTVSDEILLRRVPILEFPGRRPAQDLADSLFASFMDYARHHWTYVASARAGGEQLLDGTATEAPCGGIATALKILIETHLDLDVEYITLSGYVWTQPSNLCFDRRVRGNVSRFETAPLFSEGCLFNEHYFIRCGDKYYDPCLDSVYTGEMDAVRKRYRQDEVISKGTILAGPDPMSLLVFNPVVVVPGWQRGAWHIVQEKDVLEVVKDKYDLMNISIKLPRGGLADTARTASRSMFDSVGRVPFWIAEHRRAGVQVV